MSEKNDLAHRYYRSLFEHYRHSQETGVERLISTVDSVRMAGPLERPLVLIRLKSTDPPQTARVPLELMQKIALWMRETGLDELNINEVMDEE